MFAILKTGARRPAYTIREMIRNGVNAPIDGKIYRTEEAARAAAEAYGIHPEITGDIYEIAAYQDTA